MSIVQEYLESKRKEELSKENAKLISFMFEEGLYTKEYYDGKTENISNYPFYDKHLNKRYKKIPVTMTDEETKEIKELMLKKESKKDAEKNTSEDIIVDEENTIAVVIRVIGFAILLIGIVAGFIVLKDGLLNSAICWIATIFSGVSFIGFSEIIVLLQDIENNQIKDRRNKR